MRREKRKKDKWEERKKLLCFSIFLHIVGFFIIIYFHIYICMDVISIYIYIYIYTYIYRLTSPLANWVECSPITQETRVQSQVKSYQRLKKCYLISPCLTLSIIRYVSRVKWSNPRKGIAPFLTPWCRGY